MADHPPPATPPKPVAGLVQSSALGKRGFEVFSWGGVANPFNSCSRYTGCPQAEPAKPALVSVAPLAAATTPPETDQQKKTRETIMKRMAEEATAFSKPGATAFNRASNLFYGSHFADSFIRTYGVERGNAVIPEIFRSSPERKQLIQRVGNEFLDTMLGHKDVPIPIDQNGKDNLHDNMTFAKTYIEMMERSGIQGKDLSYSRMGTTVEAFIRQLDSINHANSLLFNNPQGTSATNQGPT